MLQYLIPPHPAQNYSYIEETVLKEAFMFYLVFSIRQQVGFLFLESIQNGPRYLLPYFKRRTKCNVLEYVQKNPQFITFT